MASDKYISEISTEPLTARQIQNQLFALDAVLPRPVEDIIAVTGITESDLPQVMQDRLAQKRYLRQLLSTL